jgi:hypothetical protein
MEEMEEEIEEEIEEAVVCPPPGMMPPPSRTGWTGLPRSTT